MSSKVSRTVWDRGKVGDNIKFLPIVISSGWKYYKFTGVWFHSWRWGYCLWGNSKASKCPEQAPGHRAKYY